MPVSPYTLKKTAPVILILISCSLFPSCGSSSLTKTTNKSYQAISGLIPRRVPVAQVRPKDLRKLPTGAERALAWERHLDASRYAYNSSWVAPKNYKPATLPVMRTLPSGAGLLPPLNPGQRTNLEGRGNLPSD